MSEHDWLYHALKRADAVGEREADRFGTMMTALAVVVCGGYALGYWLGSLIARGGQ